MPPLTRHIRWVPSSEVNSFDTIAAPASAPGGAARAIIRISGNETFALLSECFRPADADLWRSATRPLRHPGILGIDEPRLEIPVAVLWWPTGRSYTGEPLAEIHLPGSPPLVDAVLAVLYATGIRPARPGEFTQRAFLNGRIDLVQAEAVLGVIDADDQAQLRQALTQLAGGISREIAECRETLLLHLADLEAGLDFVEEDIEFVDRRELQRRLDETAAVLERLLAQAGERMHSRGGRTVVLVGLPNAGKSTLFNTLTGAQRALVSDVAGTTRDTITTEVEWQGTRIQLVDTAGWEEEADPIQSIARQLREDQIRRADLICWCLPADASPHEQQIARRFRQQLGEAPERVLDVLTKADRLAEQPASAEACEGFPVSALAGTGIDELRREILERLDSSTTSGELVGSTAARCRESLRRALESIRAAREALVAGLGDELLSVEMREALESLGMICGSVYTDDILDRIFSRFCIGK